MAIYSSVLRIDVSLSALLISSSIHVSLTPYSLLLAKWLSKRSCIHFAAHSDPEESILVVDTGSFAFTPPTHAVLAFHQALLERVNHIEDSRLTSRAVSKWHGVIGLLAFGYSGYYFCCLGYRRPEEMKACPAYVCAELKAVFRLSN